MKEDMEDGHFDADGNFIFDKKGKEIKDAWLDNVDWAGIKQKAGKQWVDKDQESDDDDLPMPTMTDERKKVIFEELFQLLKPNQTVAKALSELKKSKGLSAAEERKRRWAAKKAGTAIEETEDEKKTTRLSGLADEMINAGFMDAYEWTRERIKFLLEKVNPSIGEGLDMFSDEPPAVTASASKDAPSTSGAQDDLDTVMWEYKEDDGNATKVQGPFTSEQMAQRQQNGKLAQKGVARRVSTSEFHPVARIDFDIYC
ncbi:hypothetical protein WR25_11802 [Diploscapter pachys]|uniref:GYF domain-containing protein n=1 Tax=Diploscapter pachys TaxID=2018661 RepID=A0A2A2KLI9_9BILA|nr:hypothetical protein WR25_11802 [Diploscapter pachys]